IGIHKQARNRKKVPKNKTGLSTILINTGLLTILINIDRSISTPRGMQVAAGGIVRQQTIFSGSIHRTQRSKRLMYTPSIVHRAQLAINPVAVEKGIKAVISVNFSVCGKRRFNNLRANFVREIPRKEFFNTHSCLHQLSLQRGRYGAPALKTRSGKSQTHT